RAQGDKRPTDVSLWGKPVRRRRDVRVAGVMPPHEPRLTLPCTWPSWEIPPLPPRRATPMPPPALGGLCRLKVLLLGSGAREHALPLALSLDPDVSDLLALPGNPGIARLARCLPGDPTQPGLVVRIARDEQVDL